MKKYKLLIVMDIVELLLLIVSLFVFTIIFKLVGTYSRYVFLLGDVYVIYSFSKTLTSLENHL